MRIVLYASVLLALGACASGEKMSSEIQAELAEKWQDRVGRATKSDMVQDLGQPEWCRSRTVGGETCRFRRNLGTKWTGPETDRKHHAMYDEVIAEFDASGILRKADVKTQR